VLVAVFPKQDVERLLTDFHDVRDALFAERTARQRAEQKAADQEKELQHLTAEMRTFTVLRDNFHELYRQERDGRIAAERVAHDRIAERDRIQAELDRLHADNAQLRTALVRTQRPRALALAPDRELRGTAQVTWKPRVLEER
jgi:SMC interacting uncharacterized protein involved in chromosome segregation